MSKESSPTCFVISPIGEENSPERYQANLVFDCVIQEPLEQCGYRAERADHITEAGSIPLQVINLLLDAPLVLADLSGRNANVFYELAIRHMIGKPVVQIMHKKDKLPFDVLDIRTVRFDPEDPRSVKEAKAQIKAQVQGLKENPQVDSLITLALAKKAAGESKKAADQREAEMTARLDEIKASLSQIKKGGDTWL